MTQEELNKIFDQSDNTAETVELRNKYGIQLAIYDETWEYPYGGFASDVPTKDGVYLWRENNKSKETAYCVYIHEGLVYLGLGYDVYTGCPKFSLDDKLAVSLGGEWSKCQVPQL